MKNRLIIGLILFSTIISQELKSQDYSPFPETTARWSNTLYGFWEPGMNLPKSSHGYYYEMRGDTSINGITYNKIYYQKTWNEIIYEDLNQQTIITESANGDGPGQLIGLIRQEEFNKKVYFRRLNTQEFGCHSSSITPNEDYLLYDFNLEIGDTFVFASQEESEVLSIDSIELIDGSYRKTFNFNNFKVIEGIGSDYGLFGRPYFEGGCVLNCFKEEDKYLISGESISYCDSIVIVSNTENLIEENFKFDIQPNPFRDVLRIQGNRTSIDGEFNLLLIDGLGRKCINEQMNPFGTIDLELSTLTKGFYTLIITNATGQNVFIDKLLKVD